MINPSAECFSETYRSMECPTCGAEINFHVQDLGHDGINIEDIDLHQCRSGDPAEQYDLANPYHYVLMVNRILTHLARERES